MQRQSFGRKYMKLKTEVTSGGGRSGSGSFTFYARFFCTISVFILHGLRFLKTISRVFSIIFLKFRILYISGWSWTHGDPRAEQGSRAAGRWHLPRGWQAVPLGVGAAADLQFNNGNLHFTNERINSREMVFLATVALCFKGVGFI